jgi:battenin
LTSPVRLLGLCNNFAYVVMLSAAHDILTKQQSDNSTTPVRIKPIYRPIGYKSSILELGFAIALFKQFLSLLQTPPSLNGDFEVRNSSNSTRYDCNPVSTAVNTLNTVPQTQM